MNHPNKVVLSNACLTILTPLCAQVNSKRGNKMRTIIAAALLCLAIALALPLLAFSGPQAQEPGPGAPRRPGRTGI